MFASGRRLLSRTKRLARYVRAFGLSAGSRLYARLALARHGLVRIGLPNGGAPLVLRARTSDKSTFEQVFVAREYDLAFLKLALAPRIIIDGGANIGLATRFFAGQYPDALIFAVEPEGSNYELLVQNTRHLPNVSPVRGALWSHDASLRIMNPLADKWAFRVAELTEGNAPEVRGITVPAIMSRARRTHIDILKLDIEGAELELFNANYESWLGNVGIVIVELHDRLRAGCSEVFYRAIRNYNFKTFHSGEHVIVVRESDRA